MTGILSLPQCDGLADLIGQEFALSSGVKRDQLVPHHMGVHRQGQVEGNKENLGGVRVLEFTFDQQPEVSRRHTNENARRTGFV